MKFDRKLEAFMAAERIINMVESAGFDITDPNAIINYGIVNTAPNEMRYAFGASRIAIWDDDYCDYVIKIALNEEYEKYCQHEVEVYKAAEREGLADKFAWCACYAEPTYVDGKVDIPGVYIMEYVDCDEDTNTDEVWTYGYKQYCEERGLDSSSYAYSDEYNDWSYDSIDEDLTVEFVESGMTEEQKRMFNMFMMKWCITDIHTGNIGHIGNRVVILDYAGWNW